MFAQAITRPGKLKRPKSWTTKVPNLKQKWKDYLLDWLKVSDKAVVGGWEGGGSIAK